MTHDESPSGHFPGSPEAVRARRLAEVWRASAPSNEESERLRGGFERRPERRRCRLRMLVIALVQGFTLGGATLAAAAWLADKTLPLFEPGGANIGTVEQEVRATKARVGRSSRAAAGDDKVPAAI